MNGMKEVDRGQDHHDALGRHHRSGHDRVQNHDLNQDLRRDRDLDQDQSARNHEVDHVTIERKNLEANLKARVEAEAELRIRNDEKNLDHAPDLDLTDRIIYMGQLESSISHFSHNFSLDISHSLNCP